MLKIFNTLHHFIEDCYRQYSVREFARITKLSPPTASQTLKTLFKENLLTTQTQHHHLFFKAKRESPLFIGLSQAYWKHRLYDTGLVDYLQKTLLNPTIVLFGSLAKAEAKNDSDIDLAIFAPKKDINLKSFEKKFKRTIQTFTYPSLNHIPTKELRNNIINGCIIAGRLKL